MTSRPSPASTPPSLRIAAAALVALIVASVALAVVPVAGTSPGYVLALVKVAALGFLVKRVLEAHVYTLQWSSMLILLFLAEGTVRAMSDPPPRAGLGAFEAACATAFFVAVLRFLRPLKKASTTTRAKR